MNENFFPWNNSEIVDKQYLTDNYIVIDNDTNSNKAIVFFSGNGIFFPNTEETFDKIIVKKNRYEWSYIANSKKLKKFFRRMIFVRDIYKQWYVSGINSNVDSIPKLSELICFLTAGFQVTTCGNSAGGYAAIIIGNAIQAKKIFSFSGQFVIDDQVENGLLLKKYLDDTKKSLFYNTLNFIDDTTWKHVIHFYPAYCEWDMEQIKNIKGTSVICFPLNSSVHGETIPSDCYEHIFTMSLSELRELRSKYGDLIEINSLEKMIVPFSSRFLFRAKEKYRKMKSIIRGAIK